jgi:hypothetical protein
VNLYIMDCKTSPFIIVSSAPCSQILRIYDSISRIKLQGSTKKLEISKELIELVECLSINTKNELNYSTNYQKIFGLIKENTRMLNSNIFLYYTCISDLPNII